MDTGISEASIEERNEQLRAISRGVQTPAPAAVTEPQEVVEPVQETQEAVQAPVTTPIKELFPGYSKLTPEDRAAADAWFKEEKRKQDELKSLAGKVPSTQREAAALKKEVEAARKRMAELERGITTQGQKDRLETWEEWRKVAPEDAAAIEQRMSPIEKQVVALTKKLEAAEALAERTRALEEDLGWFKEQRHTYEITQKKQELLQIHPDYDEIATTFVDPETGAEMIDATSPFGQWAKTRPRVIELLAADDPEAHSMVMHEYKRFAGISNAPATQTPAKPVDPKVAVVAKRTEQLRQTTDPKTVGAPPAKPVGNKSEADIEATVERIRAFHRSQNR